jgi:hypothetical protein
MSREPRVLACDLTALPPGGKERLAALSEDLFGRAQQARSLPDGLELGYQQASAGTIAQLAEFIALDRLCCPFIRHGLFVEPDTGSTWLHLSGGDGVKRVIASDVLGMVPEEVARAGGLTN